jgi:hypothetical protein
MAFSWVPCSWRWPCSCNSCDIAASAMEPNMSQHVHCTVHARMMARAVAFLLCSVSVLSAVCRLLESSGGHFWLAGAMYCQLIGSGSARLVDKIARLFWHLKVWIIAVGVRSVVIYFMANLNMKLTHH